MVAAVKQVAEANKWPLHLVYVWVDYSSIPQKNRKSQESAINSLALYASLADALVIIAPDGRHASNDSLVSRESYQKRMWCRAEQVCAASAPVALGCRSARALM